MVAWISWRVTCHNWKLAYVLNLQNWIHRNLYHLSPIPSSKARHQTAGSRIQGLWLWCHLCEIDGPARGGGRTLQTLLIDRNSSIKLNYMTRCLQGCKTVAAIAVVTIYLWFPFIFPSHLPSKSVDPYSGVINFSGSHTWTCQFWEKNSKTKRVISCHFVSGGVWGGASMAPLRLNGCHRGTP